MTDHSPADDKQERAAAAIKKADSGSNHQAGVDGDDDSTADRKADESAQR